MFIVILTYTKPINEVEHFLKEHRIFLEKYYKSGHFLLSGRREPRTGGVIVATAQSLVELEEVIKHDPFYQEKIAAYEIIEFIPSMSADGFENLISSHI